MAIKRLLDGGATLSLMETNTGGHVAQRLTSASGGTDALRGAWVVTGETMAARLFGLNGIPFVSADAAQLGAEWARHVSGATWGMAIMGTLGKDEHLYGQRTGECWIAMSGPREVSPEKFPYGGVSEQSRQWISNRALDILRRNA